MRSHIGLKAAVLGGALGFLFSGSANTASAQELLLNANLDKCTATEIVPGFFLPKPRNWQNVGSRSLTGPYEDEMSSEPWAGPAPTPVTTDGDAVFPDGVGLGADGAVFFKPFSGNLTPNGLATGHLYQDVPATPGVTYYMSGWAGAEPNALMAGAVFALEFLNAANTVIASNQIDLLPTLYIDNGEPFDYKQYSISGVAPAGTFKARVRASMLDAQTNPLGGGQAFVVDDFSLTVPEPTSLAVIGLGGLGLLARRRAH